MNASEGSFGQLPPLNAAKGNYFVRHWRGDLSLGVSYWVNGTILGNAIPAAFLGFVNQRGEGDLRFNASLILGGLALSSAAWFWGIVGIWRSADRHQEHGGSVGWARAAKAMVVFGMLAAFGNINSHSTVPQVLELARIAAGKDDIPRIQITIAPDAHSVLLSGTFGQGSAEEVLRVLNAAPHVKTVELDSSGGRVAEAREIASLVRGKKLNTYVERSCASACTIIFLAGKDRGATPNSKIGFHRGAFGGQESAAFGPDDAMISAYRQAGISGTFIDKVRATEHKSVWIPTREELLQNGVVTRTSIGGETAFASDAFKSLEDLRAELSKIELWATIEKRYPGSVSLAAARVWAAKQRGETADVALSAGRTVVSELLPKAMQTAPVQLLDVYVDLMLDELKEARRVSPQACAKLLDGKLNIVATLPESVIKRDYAFTQQVFAAPIERKAPPTAAATRTAMRQAVAGLSPVHLEVVQAAEKFSDRPLHLCDAFLAFYGSIAKLPDAQRHIALRSMLQS